MKICVVGDIWDAILGNTKGGAQRQMALIASYLARRGHQVTGVVPNLCCKEYTVNGIRIVSGWQANKGVKVLRYFTYRLPYLKRVLCDIKADLYYMRGFSVYAPTVINVSRKLNVISAIGLASDSDLLVDRARIVKHMKSSLSDMLADGWFSYWYYYYYALRKASWIITQTNEQVILCQKRGLKNQLIPNIVEVPDESLLNRLEEVDVVWAGAISLWKGVNHLLELAVKLPDVNFVVVGALEHEELRPILNELRNKRNVVWLDNVPNSELINMMSKARIVINTSPTEGFANTVLEAWALGKPVVTLNFNPNGLLSGEKPLGYFANGDLHRMAVGIRYYLTRPDERKKAGDRAQHYVKINHSPEKICDLYENLVNNS